MKQIAQWYRQRSLAQRSLVAGALLLALSVPAFALAQDATGTPPAQDTTADTTVAPGQGRGPGFGRGEGDFGLGMGRHGAFAEGFAYGLGGEFGDGLRARFGNMMGGMMQGSMMHGGIMRGGMMRGDMGRLVPPSGTVSEVGEDTITVEVTGQGEGVGRNREWLSVEATVKLDDETIVLANDLSAAEVADIEVGSTVAVSPRFEWGQPVAQLIYIGTSDELADQTFHGQLVSIEGDVLQLESRVRWAEKFAESEAAEEGDEGTDETADEAAEAETLTVVTDADTIWVDSGTFGRPDELPVGTSLHVLGVQGEDGEVQAVLITAGGPLRGR